MKKFLLLAVCLCSISAWAQIPDCSQGTCAGVGVPSVACHPGNKYAQMDAPGTNWTCSGLTPHWVQDAGGGATLPSAATGQILSNTNGGTTYAAQGQILYSQAGDTVASIETACSSLCTYMVTVPQTITLASSHALSSNVQLDFRAGGKWTVNGAFTLTIPGNVVGTLNQHFAGSSTVKFGPLQSIANVEWFGAIGDWNGTTGTDNTTAIQRTLNALSAGNAVLQASLYKITAALTLTAQSRIGIIGTAAGGSYTPTTAPNPSGLVSTSASADFIDVSGTTSVTWSFDNVFRDFSLQRSVAPTGTATGISSNLTWGEIIDNVQVMDSVRGFYFHQALASGVGHIENCAVTWGFNGITGYTGTQFVGFYLDSADGNAEASFRGRHLLASSTLAAGVNTIGMALLGNAINDVMVYELETATTNYGVYIQNTGGGGAFSSGDIHFWGSIFDSSRTSSIFVTGLTAATNGRVEFNGGYALGPAVGGAHNIDIESSSGVNISNMQIGPFISPTTDYVLINGGGNNSVTNNSIFGVSVNGINLASSTTQNTIVGNQITGSSATGGLIALTNATYNAIGLNSLGGTAAIGFNSNAGSNWNTGVDTNSYASTLTAARSTAGDNPFFLQQPGGVPAMQISQSGATTYSQIGFGGTELAPVAQFGIGNPSESGLGVANKFFWYNVASTALEATLDLSGNFVSNSLKSKVYTVSTLPTASTLSAGTQVVVSDGAGTPPTCTGSGTNYQIAITNATTWSCH